MRPLILLLCAASGFAQIGRSYVSNTTEDLRGVSTVSRQVAWASGTHGTYLRTTDGGLTWIPAQVPDAATVDFRAVVAFSADEAFLMSAGPGDQSRIYHTADAGQHWQRQLTAAHAKSFFDSMVFWDSKHGIVLGDPIPDDSGKLKFEVLMTDDGQTWHAVSSSALPEAVAGEGAFAASNSCLALVPQAIPASSTLDPNLWFATGGKVARVFHSSDRGQTWHVVDTPIIHGPESAGIFSIAFRDPMHGVIAGGDFQHPDDDGPNLAFTSDGGATWTLATMHPLAYFSSVAYDRHFIQKAIALQDEQKKKEAAGEKIRVKPIDPQRLFIVGTDFVFDSRPPNNPRRIDGVKKPRMKFNAASAFPEGGALIVGPKGSIAYIQ